ncbi:hypothetical protein Acor_66970 [Acrocarpospora corrugata]|uniref:AAA+ ATPase domain-containing protein n=1 Tax=Acrocarpospora corrugata TaxID=35763 RepID=A0A5M3W8G8_9ACTN|nr:tetratricopeptide repeat protein [Acrocarpospora corrugata]GES04629.1 hypothetical protein Acor_66970 [Acrocarpospora corrugata]
MRRNPGDGGLTYERVNRIDGTVLGPALQIHTLIGDVNSHIGARLPPPQQLPRPCTLVGRGEQLDSLHRELAAETTRVILVTGSPGVGKTSIVVRCAHNMIAGFPDGQLYVDLQGYAPVAALNPADILAGFIRAFGIAHERIPANPAERSALFKSLVAGRRVLVVLDNANSAAQVADLVPGDCMVLVTSREKLVGLVCDGARLIQLRPLSRNDALDLLRQIVDPARLEREPESAHELVALCEGVPLALSIVAARLAGREHLALSDMVRDLAQEKQRLDRLSAENRGVRTALWMSYRRLPDEVARLYRALGRFPGVIFDDSVAAALLDQRPDQVRPLIERLIEANLLDDVPGRGYTFHALVRLHAREMADSTDPSELRTTIERAVNWYVQSARSASRSVKPSRRIPVPDSDLSFNSPAAALDWMHQEYSNIRTAAKLAFEHHLYEDTWHLVDTLWSLFLHRGYQVERLNIEELGLLAAQACHNLEGEAKMLNRVGHSLRAQARYDDAKKHFELALDIWRQLDDNYRIAGAYRRLGLVELDCGRYQEAAALFRTAIKGYDATREPQAAARATCDLAHTMIEDGRRGEAAPLLAGALTALDGDPYNKARALVLLGLAHSDQPGIAEEHLQQGLKLMREIKSPDGEAFALQTLGLVAQRSGQLEKASEYYWLARVLLAGMDSDTAEIDQRLRQVTSSDVPPGHLGR